MDYEYIRIKVTFITEPLGTLGQPDVTSKFIARRFEEGGGVLPDDEMETLDREVAIGTTAFHKLDGKHILYDYQFKGFLKEAGRIFNGLQGVKALKSKIDNLVFVEPRRIPLHLPDGAEADFFERPLRAETPQGPRVALARSERLPGGTWFECRLKVYKSQITRDLLLELMTYGADKGLLQWRNGGWGRFTFEVTEPG